MVPRWIVRLLEVIVRDTEQNDVVGDLEELHRRRLARWGASGAWTITVAEGLSLAATHAARRVGYGVVGGAGWISPMELRLALRLVLKQPVMTLTSVVALGVGIGLAAGGFSMFQQGLYSDLPFENGDRWVVIETYSAETGLRSRLDLERLRAFRASASSFDYIAGAAPAEFNVVHSGGEVERVAGAHVTPGTFAYLPYAPVVGRLLIPADGTLESDPVVLIRESFWERSFARDPDVLNQSLRIAGANHRVVGVMPDDAGYPSEGELWLALDEETMGAADDRSPIAGGRQVGILAAGVSRDGAMAQLAQLSEGISAPGRGAEAQLHNITSITRTMTSPQAQVMAIVLVTLLVMVLLVIAANVSNLVAARTCRRAPELAVRTALGASRVRIVTQLFVEACVIGALASALGLMLAGFTLSTYDRFLDELPFWVDLRLDPTTAVVAVALALLASTVMGLVPALRLTRADPGASLREAGGRATRGIGRIGGAMIVAEVAISVALLGAGVVFAEGFRAYVEPSFHLPDDRVLTARFTLDWLDDVPTEGRATAVGDSIMTVIRRLEETLAGLPGVAAAGVASHLPRAAPFPEAVEIEGKSSLVTSPVVYQGPGLFDVLEVGPLLGRDLDPSDLESDAPRVVVVNQAFAVENFGSIQVLGRRIRLAPHSDAEPALPWSEIVGVVPNVIEVTGSGRAAGVYHPMVPVRFLSAAVRVDSDPLALTGVLRRAVFDLDPDLNVSEIVRLDDVGAKNRTALRAMSAAIIGIGVVTLLLSLAGVYSIVSLAVTQRTREIGMRVALGAPTGSILWSVLRRSGLLVVGGASVGALAGIQASRMPIFVFALPEPGAWLFPGLVGVMAIAGLLACWVPARRALSIRPVEALRYDT